jgi:hypothetical protein
MSHRLYYSALAGAPQAPAAIQFKDPRSKEDIAALLEAGGSAMLLELRIGGGANGAQTVFPGSTHKSGEAIAWEDRFGEPAAVADADLLRAAARTAAACMMARLWPPVGVRHDLKLAVGGFLARCGLSVSEVRLFAEAIGRAVEFRTKIDVKDTVRCAGDAAEAFAKGENVYGFPMIAEYFGEKVAKRLAEWLGFNGATDDKGAGADDDKGAAGADAESAKQTAARQREARARALAARQQSAQAANRTLVKRAAADAPLTPVMKFLDEHLTTDEPEPPMRNINGVPVEVRERSPSIDFHELNSEGENEAGLENKAQLPAPPIPLISEHDATSLAIMVERYLDYYVETANSVRDVAPPAGFLNHYAAYRDSNLPIVRAVATMPLVLPNRRILSSNGLDRKNEIVFRIPPELMKFIPDPGTITKEEVLRLSNTCWTTGSST